MAQQPVPRGEDQPPLLGQRDAGRRAAKVGILAPPHFDEHGGRPVAADQVDLAALDTEVTLNQPQPPAGQIFGRPRLAGITA